MVRSRNGEQDGKEDGCAFVCVIGIHYSVSVPCSPDSGNRKYERVYSVSLAIFQTQPAFKVHQRSHLKKRFNTNNENR